MCKSGLSFTQNLNSNETLQRDTRVFNAHIFVVELKTSLVLLQRTNRSFHGFSGHRRLTMGVKQNLVARQRVLESLMIIRRASLPSLNFRFVQEQESISIAKKDKTLIKVSDLFSLGKKPFILCVLWEHWDRFLRT